MKDSEVLRRIVLRDERILDHLYKKYYKMMTNIVLSNSGTLHEAKDVFQDALLVLWQKAADKEFVLSSRISTYLYSVCLNLWRKELDRKNKLSDEVVEEVEYQSHEVEEKRRIIRACIEELGDVCREVLSYYYFDGLSMKDIAKKMNFANTDTAKTKKYKCKQRLDQLIKSRYNQEDFFD